jgi:hypothetical protein
MLALSSLSVLYFSCLYVGISPFAITLLGRCFLFLQVVAQKDKLPVAITGRHTTQETPLLLTFPGA